MQPTAESRNKITNNDSKTVRDADQPVRQSRSAKSIETMPVSKTAEEKNRNSRQPRWMRGLAASEIIGASPIFHVWCVIQKMAISKRAKNIQAVAMRT